MNKEEAEKKICELVRRIDGVRAMGVSKEKEEGRIAQLDEEIRELKKITGPRHLTGTFKLG